jgi:hypothetical protein
VKQLFILLTSIGLISCLNQSDRQTVSKRTNSDTVLKTYVDTIQELEKQSTTLNYDSLGELISKIRFDVKTNDLQNWKDGKVPWIRIDSPQVDLKNLIGKDDIVIPEGKVTVVIDYPLTNNYKFELLSKKGFTREQLIKGISNEYYLLYDEEEKSATVKTIPAKNRKIYNRNQTNGKYGIWGHDIGDLVLDEIQVYKNAKGEVTLTLQLES